ncbi:hypothetical protein [Streptomyces sp. NPDC021622]|uniref:hypothetical protein n=1 Tax=Streptomyces sp. NPDC021622 TaxID=3155013 RepID=UPI0034020D5D
MSSPNDAQEPVFVRSNWGTSRYVLNANSPVGLFLIVVLLLLAGGGVYYFYASTRWSEGELRDAVYAVTDELDGAYDDSPEGLESGYGSGYAGRIERAIEATGEGPAHAIGLRVHEASDDRYEVSTAHTKDVYCMHVSRTDYLVSAEVADGTC